ncbi:MAG TPA: Mut7-C RNAse domain-containing protein [Pirellulales bacterium]|nr:Mut7-C RNAse domain-containing protein [Pirellulales bacterium]
MSAEPDFFDRAEQVFRSLLWRSDTKPLMPAVASLVEEVVARVEGGQAAEVALTDVFSRARRDAIERLLARSPPRWRRIVEITVPQAPPQLGPDFHCDAGLGGLARWLRAAGYDAAFWPGIDDDDLLRKATAGGAILITSDRRLMDRGVIASGAVAALLTPISLKKREQFAFVRDRLELPLKPTRCMACGGRLAAVDKEAVRERIPPRTYPWLDDYFECQRCRRLFWQGTHWQRIERVLRTEKN